MRKHSDVLIIGGGIISLSCAYYLAKAGRGVRILERQKIGNGASYANCGLMYFSHLIPLCEPGAAGREIKRILMRKSSLYIKPSLDLKRLLWFLHFSGKCNSAHLAHAVRARESLMKASESLFRQLIREEGIDGEWEKKGILLVFKTERAFENYRTTNDRLKPYGFGATSYAGKELFQLEPALREDLYGGRLHETDSHLRPEALLREWENVIRNMGVIIEEGVRVTSFETRNGKIMKVHTSRGSYTADDFVLAAGAWTPEIARNLKLDIPIQPAKGYSITMDHTPAAPSIPCYFHEPNVVATPWKSGFRLGGTLEFSGLNSTLVPGRIARLKTAAKAFLKGPVSEPNAEAWAGMRPMTRDDLPVIGRAPDPENLFLAAGHGMLGVSTATGTGKLISELVTGTPPHIDPSYFRFERFS